MQTSGPIDDLVKAFLVDPLTDLFKGRVLSGDDLEAGVRTLLRMSYREKDSETKFIGLLGGFGINDADPDQRDITHKIWRDMRGLVSTEAFRYGLLSAFPVSGGQGAKIQGSELKSLLFEGRVLSGEDLKAGVRTLLKMSSMEKDSEPKFVDMLGKCGINTADEQQIERSHRIWTSMRNLVSNEGRRLITWEAFKP